VIFRFVSILGERYTHGHVFDFYCALKRDPTRLKVLGDGARRSPTSTSRTASTRSCRRGAPSTTGPVSSVYNLGTDETVVVDDSIAIITEHLGARPAIEHTGGGARLGRRQPADPSRLRADPRARLGADADDPRGAWSGSTRTPTRGSARREPDVKGCRRRGADARRSGGGDSHVSVIFSRAPLRISLGGGGTDLPSYYREHGGFLVAGAIDKYVYMLTHTVFQRRYKMKYSETEEVDEIARSATRSCARRCCVTGAGTRSRSPRWPTCPPAPAWARRARSRSAC
jgi:hypothetical protein